MRDFSDIGRRLQAAEIPFHGVFVDRVDYTDSATEEQRAAGDAILAAWDWDADPVPAEVSPLQAKIALSRSGYLSNVEQVVEAWGVEAEIAYRNALTFRRDSPLLLAISAAIPGLADDLDDIFRAAALIAV